ncbi:MAG: 4Fe-4S dicluster domain-containing protein [Bacillota bacterium]
MTKGPIIRKEFCKNCAICLKFCPKDVFDLDSRNKVFVNNPEACISCKMCQIRCPHLAIVFKEEE